MGCKPIIRFNTASQDAQLDNPRQATTGSAHPRGPRLPTQPGTARGYINPGPPGLVTPVNHRPGEVRGVQPSSPPHSPLHYWPPQARGQTSASPPWTSGLSPTGRAALSHLAGAPVSYTCHHPATHAARPRSSFLNMFLSLLLPLLLLINLQETPDSILSLPANCTRMKLVIGGRIRSSTSSTSCVQAGWLT